MTCIILVLMLLLSQNYGFYIRPDGELPVDEYYRISSTDFLRSPICEKEIQFKDNGAILMTYVKYSPEGEDFVLRHSVILQIFGYSLDNSIQIRNILGTTTNMTRFTFYGNNIRIRLCPDACQYFVSHRKTDFVLSVRGSNDANICPDPGTPENGYRIMRQTEFTIGTNIHYFCHQDYRLAGHDIIICVKNTFTGLLSWSEDKPICIKACEKPLYPRFGHVSDITANGTVEFSCQKPFVLIGPKTLTCMHHGAISVWNGFPPKCHLPMCPINGSLLIATYKRKFITTSGLKNVSCTWDIITRNNNCVHIYFETFDLTESGAVFEIRKYGDFQTSDDNLVFSSKTMSGDLSRTITVCARHLRVHYESGHRTDMAGYRGVNLMYTARPTSYHALYQRAVGIGGDKITAEPTKATGQTSADDSSDSNIPTIVAGVVVPVVILIIAGVAFYIWYRKKYPVRMIIGKDFGKFSNPVYSNSTSTATLTRTDSFENEIHKMTVETRVSHDNPVDLSDETEYQPMSRLTLLGSMGLRDDLDNLDSPEIKMKSRKQRKKVIQFPKVVIEEEAEEREGETTKVSDTSSDITHDSDKTESDSDETSDGEGFRPITDAPKIKRKRVSAYLNEVLDRQNSTTSTSQNDSDTDMPTKTLADSSTDGIDVTVQVSEEQQINVESINKEQSLEELHESQTSQEMLDVQNSHTFMQDINGDRSDQVESVPDRSKIVINIEKQDRNNGDGNNDDSEHSDIPQDVIPVVGESGDTSETDKRADVNKTAEEIMSNLLENENRSSVDNVEQIDTRERNDLPSLIMTTEANDGLSEKPEGDLACIKVNISNVSEDSESSTSDDDSSVSREGEVWAKVWTPETNATTATENEEDTVEVLCSDISSSLADDGTKTCLNHSTENDITFTQNDTFAKSNDAVSFSTSEVSENAKEVDGLEDDKDGRYEHSNIVGYLTSDELRELSARTKSFGEESLSSVYSSEMVEEENAIIEITEQDFSSGLSLDVKDNLEIPHQQKQQKLEMQIPTLIGDTDNDDISSENEDTGVTTDESRQSDVAWKSDDDNVGEHTTSGVTSVEFSLLDSSLNGDTAVSDASSTSVDIVSFDDKLEPQDSQANSMDLNSTLGEYFGGSSPIKSLLDFSDFEKGIDSSADSPSTANIPPMSNSFEMGENSTNEQDHNGWQFHGNEIQSQYMKESDESEDDSDDDDSDDDDENASAEYIINPKINEDIQDDEENKYEIEELETSIEKAENERRNSITFDNPTFDAFDISKLQRNLPMTDEESGGEYNSDIPVETPTSEPEEILSLDNPFRAFEEMHSLAEEPQQERQKLRLISVPNILETPPTSSESSSDDSESETGSAAEYQINPFSDPDEVEDEFAYAVPQDLENFGDASVSIPTLDTQDNAIGKTKQAVLNLGIDDIHERMDELHARSESSSHDSTTNKVMDNNMASSSESDHKVNGVTSATASAPAPKKFSLASISRKFKSSFKTTPRPDLQPGDKDIVDI